MMKCPYCESSIRSREIKDLLKFKIIQCDKCKKKLRFKVGLDILLFIWSCSLVIGSLIYYFIINNYIALSMPFIILAIFYIYYVVSRLLIVGAEECKYK
jgi:hypothetical protein